MLKRLYVDNYRCLVNFTLELQELTLLVGPNGSGKSSVLDVLYALRQLLSGSGKVADADLFPSRSLTRWQSRNLQIFEIVVSLPGESDTTYRLEVEHEKESRSARIILESLKVDGKPLFEFRNGEVQSYRDDHVPGSQYGADKAESALARVAARPTNQRLTRFLDFMRGVSVCALDPKHFQAESVSEEPRLRLDGGNFASWYRHQSQERQDLILGLVTALREIVSDFQSIRMEKVGSEARSFLAVFEGKSGRYELRLDELSDGQRALIALYSLIHLAGEQDVLFLDEPDNFVALSEIQPWLIALADACGTRPRQAVLCSHHPELIDYLGTEAGVLLKREKLGEHHHTPVERDSLGFRAQAFRNHGARLGALSRRVQLVLLCEDQQHEAFARRFLNEMGWETRAMRVEKVPGGRGAGEQFVRKRFPLELKAHRTRPVTQALVVLIDGDAEGTAARLNQLGQACREADVTERAGQDRVAVFIPTWNIETWLAYLDGEDVSEERRDYPRLPRERDCQRHVEALVRMCRAGELRRPAPASLEMACGEYQARLARDPR